MKFKFVSSTALALNLVSAFHIAFMPVTQACADELRVESREQVLDVLQEADAQLDRLASEFKNDVEVETKSSKIESRWNRKFARGLPKAKARISADIAKLSDKQVSETLTEIESQDGALQAFAGLGERVQLQSILEQRLEQNLPKLAQDIGKAGGLVRYVADSKERIKSLQDHYASTTSKTQKIQRAPAAADWEKIKCAILGVILIIAILALVIGLVWMLINFSVGFKVFLSGAGYVGLVALGMLVKVKIACI